MIHFLVVGSVRYFCVYTYSYMYASFYSKRRNGCHNIFSQLCKEGGRDLVAHMALQNIPVVKRY